MGMAQDEMELSGMGRKGTPIFPTATSIIPPRGSGENAFFTPPQ